MPLPSDYAKRRRQEREAAEQYRRYCEAAAAWARQQAETDRRLSGQDRSACDAIAREFLREIEIERRARQARKET